MIVTVKRSAALRADPDVIADLGGAPSIQSESYREFERYRAAQREHSVSRRPSDAMPSPRRSNTWHFEVARHVRPTLQPRPASTPNNQCRDERKCRDAAGGEHAPLLCGPHQRRLTAPG